jgi:hypothetical protein
VLVCDNGSLERTVSVADSWAGRLPLRVIDASALPGAGPARNEGVRVARGEWIAFCDADDEVAEDWLATLCGALERHAFVAGRLERERLNSPRIRRSRSSDQQDALQNGFPEVGLPHAASANLGIHRSAFAAVGGFDPAVRYLQDTDLCWRVQLAGYPLVFVPELVISLRLRDTLAGMYRQGRNYGASQASLERRYAGVGMPPGATRPVASGATRGRFSSAVRVARGGLRLAGYFVRNRSTLGAAVWQLGWHVGHRAVPPPGARPVDLRDGVPRGPLQPARP